MLVKNNLPTVLDYGDVPHGTTLKDPGGKNHGFFIPAFRLLPGLNDVDPEAWEMWTTGRAASKGADGKPAGLNWQLEQKNVEVVRVEIEPADKDGQSIVKTVSADDFADLGAGDAIDLVKETFDAKMLNAWGEAEDKGKARSAVFGALCEQLDMINTQASGTIDENE